MQALLLDPFLSPLVVTLGNQNDSKKGNRSSFVPPVLESSKGLAIYYALVLPVVGAATYYMARGGGHLQTAVYLVVGLVAVLSLSYTTWLAKTLLFDACADARSSGEQGPSSSSSASSNVSTSLSVEES